jgi:hypothetical protein
MTLPNGQVYSEKVIFNLLLLRQSMNKLNKMENSFAQWVELNIN